MRVRRAGAVVALAVGWWAAASGLGAAAHAAQGGDAGGGERRVLVTRIGHAITPVIADHLSDGVDRAESGGYDAYVVELDTPGGLDTSMRAIVQDVLDADVPVIVYVTPAGSRAGSAGAIITYAAHVAAMAPGTAIGAATPVGLEGGDVEDKILNDATAYAESLAELRGRNAAFAADSVREGRSASAREALELGVVDLVAESLDDLLDEVDGTTVTLAGERQVTLRTAGAAVDTYDLGLLRRILQVLADPNLAYLFLSIGTLAVIYELASPGIGVGGVVGGAMIVLALFGLSVLPVDGVGLLFLGLAAALFVGELFAPGVGVFAAGGVVALVLAGLFLFDDAQGVGVSLGIVLPTAVVVGAATVVAGRLVLRTRDRPSSTTGAGALVGRTVEVRRRPDGTTEAQLDGTWWRVRGRRPLEDGDVVEVAGLDGLDLVVEPPGPGVTDEEEQQRG